MASRGGLVEGAVRVARRGQQFGWLDGGGGSVGEARHTGGTPHAYKIEVARLNGPPPPPLRSHRRLRNRGWKRLFNLLALSVSPAATSCSHPDAFVILSGTSAVLCNVLTPSREV